MSDPAMSTAGEIDRPRARRLWIATIPLYLAAACWPFRLDLPRLFPNGASRDGTALVFATPGRAVGVADPIVDAVRKTGVLDLHLVLRTDLDSQLGPARILELGTDHECANLTVGQDGQDLIVRFLREGSDGSGTPPLRCVGAFASAGASVRATLHLERGRAGLAVDDAPGVTLGFEGDPFARWYQGAELILGDSPAGDRAWLGRVESARIEVGPERFDVLDPERTTLPEAVVVWPERLTRLWSWRFVPPIVPVEVLINVLGFLPLGVLAAAAFRRRGIGFAVGGGLATSLAMELLQFGFAERSPSILDLCANTLGAFVGALAFRMRGGMLRPR